MGTFKSGFIVGRFEHIHLGHEKIINLGLTVCDRLLVFVGSAQESETLRNPYDVEYRMYLISKIYKNEIENGKLILKPLNDFEDKSELSPRWGKYVINQAVEYLKEKPECIIYGKDKDIFKCFDKETVKNISEIIVDRNVFDISATKIREYLRNDDIENWKKYVNSSIYCEYNNLKEILNNIVVKNNDI